MITTNRRTFATALRAARRAKTLEHYGRHQLGYGRMAALTDGTYLRYRVPVSVLNVREVDEDDGLTYADPRDEREERL